MLAGFSEAMTAWRMLGIAAVLAAAPSCTKDEPVLAGGCCAATDAGAAIGTAGAAGAFECPGAPDDAGAAVAADHRFTKITLTDQFYAEGASYGDFDRDGTLDVVAGPYWYRGPSFTEKYELYTPVTFDVTGYSDNFFAFPYDFDRDGWQDVLVVGFPGTQAAWFENPKQPGVHWTRHVVFDHVDNESPDFTDLTDDGQPELVMSFNQELGCALLDPSAPAAPFTFVPISPPGDYVTFTHGLGVGDVDGDGRRDVLEKTGWWRQPDAPGAYPWERHAEAFGDGGAQMFAYDVDGDGDADVITSLQAHGWGLAWFEQVPNAPFVEHVIVPPEPVTDGVVINEPHALALIDMNRDGLADIVTGERFWGHVPQGADFGAPARIYWFELVRDVTGPRYVAHLIDDASGVGTQVVAGDINHDCLPDIVVSNKKGAFVFLHELGA